jgi:hypothetical protein
MQGIYSEELSVTAGLNYSAPGMLSDGAIKTAIELAL